MCTANVCVIMILQGDINAKIDWLCSNEENLGGPFYVDYCQSLNTELLIATSKQLRCSIYR